LKGRSWPLAESVLTEEDGGIVPWGCSTFRRLFIRTDKGGENIIVM
jgi:hypothetical protein